MAMHDRNPGNVGVVPVETLQSMSGLAFLQAWRDGRLPAPPMGAALRFSLAEVEPGRAVFAGEPDARFFNPIGTVHGGEAATLLDSCMGRAVHSRLEPGRSHTTAEIKVQYVRPLTDRTGRVTAEGVVLHFGRRMATAEGHLRDAEGKRLAHGTTTCMVFGEP
ncbi:MAG: PaaI family thioesterase [Burkholderiales bacterium]